MRNIVIYSIFFALLCLWGCEPKQNFYEVGKQQVFLTLPKANTEIVLNKDSSSVLLQFSWQCKRPFVKYNLKLQDKTENPTMVKTIDVGASDYYKKSEGDMDFALAEMGIRVGATQQLYWTLVPEDPSASWCDELRPITFTRFNTIVYSFSLNAPATDAVFVLDKSAPKTIFPFQFQCSATSVNYRIDLSLSQNMNSQLSIYRGVNQQVDVTYQQIDSLLNLMGAKPNAPNDVYWRVMAIGDTIKSVTQSSSIQHFTITTFPKSFPIALNKFPSEDIALVLDYSKKDETINSLEWTFGGGNDEFILISSLNANLKDSIVTELGTANTINCTNTFWDNVLSNLGGAYLSKTIYYQISAKADINAVPSAIKKIKLTGMLKPLVDVRGSESNTYPVVKFLLASGSERFWTAKNLNANFYADGSALVEPRKSYTESVFTNFVGIAGGYYTWPTVVRSTTGDAVTEPVQGICPNGWHVPTKAECQEIIDYLGGQDQVTIIHDGNYWTSGNGSNTTGLSVVEGGYFWHSGMGDVMTDANSASSMWTSTIDGTNTAFAWESWETWTQFNSINRKLWVDGDGTASRMSNVRCIRNY